MASIDELKERVDLHDLAAWLGVKRGAGDKANYYRPNAEEKIPSLSIYASGKKFKDHAADQGGSCVDFVMHVRGVEMGEALRILHDYLGIKPERPGSAEPRREKSRAEYIADKCYAEPDRAMEYLQSRGIPTAVIRHALDRKTVGFNDWVSPKVPEGEAGHGGPAVAFIVKSLNPGHVVAVDMRYLDPKINGGVKTQAQGEKYGYGWCSDPRKLMSADKVYIVESPINALSIEAADIPYTAAFATRGVGTISSIDWRIFTGKQLFICFDKDEPDDKGRRAGQETSWKLHEMLTALDISALLVDQLDWTWNDINDLLKSKNAAEVRTALFKIERHLIAGLPPLPAEGKEPDGVKKRIFLPWHDYLEYGRYSVRPDFTNYIERKENEQKVVTFEDKNLAGFRIAGISRVKISSARSVMSGDPDDQPLIKFAISVQVPRHGPKLQRKVVDDRKLHNLDVWNEFAPVFNQAKFKRMVNILERTADLGARNVINFVGLAWRDGKLVVNEGADCYFTDPEKQCTYHNMAFISGSKADAREVIAGYRETFKKNAASRVLVWALGGHLKALIGFWPHLEMQAKKGSGKTTFINHLQRTIGFTMFSGQTIMSDFRQLTSIAHTSHPVGWDELSARPQQVIDKGVSLLQEAYQYSTTVRGSEMTQYLLSAPVLLAGEDVPVKSLIGKLVRTSLQGLKGTPLPIDLARFPVRQWLVFLSEFKRAQVLAMLEEKTRLCQKASRASDTDDGAIRMTTNYAAMLVAWDLLCEFAELQPSEGKFVPDLIETMNAHIAKTVGDREPWVWVIETLLFEIARNDFRLPYKWDEVEGEDGKPVDCLLVRANHIMDHIASSMSLRDRWNSLPVKTGTVLKEALKDAGVLVRDDVERTVGADPNTGAVGRRVSHMAALSVEVMERYGLYAVRPGFNPAAATPVSSGPQYGDHK